MMQAADTTIERGATVAIPTTSAADDAARPARSATMDMLRDHAELTKPGITMLVLITTFVGFVAALPVGGPTPVGLLLATLLGTYAVVAGASALNHVLEARPDALMRRTRHRPLPAGRVSIERALAFGLALTGAGLAVLALGTGLQATLLAGASWVLYVLVYTPLKRVTTAATIVGAVPGALPPVIGWCAASGDLGAGAWTLFGILFLWQFPHFLALGWMYREDYARGGFVNLATIDPTGEMTRRQAILYAIALVPVSLLPTPLGFAGPAYFVCALLLSLGYAAVALRTLGEPLDRRMRTLFRTSIAYLPVLLTVIVLERLVAHLA